VVTTDLGVAALLLAVLGAVAIVAPHAATRWQALRTGSPAFVEDRYAFPVDAPGEPRRVAESLVEEVVRLDGEGRPAYADADYPGLERAFRLEPTASGLRRLVLAPRPAPE
jgi:hypothetical protein